MNIQKESLGFLLVDVARLMRRKFEQSVLSTKLTHAQARALIYVSRSEGVRQVDLAEKLEVKPITLARLIDQLQNAGLVERRADASDRRAYRIYLTDAAEPELNEICNIIESMRQETLNLLQEEEINVLTSALKKIRESLCTNISEKSSK